MNRNTHDFILLRHSRSLLSRDIFFNGSVSSLKTGNSSELLSAGGIKLSTIHQAYRFQYNGIGVCTRRTYYGINFYSRSEEQSPTIVLMDVSIRNL